MLLDTSDPQLSKSLPGTAHWQTGVLRAQALPFLCLISGVVLACFAWTSVNDWGGSFFMLTETASSATPFMLAWFAGVGVVVGQWRWRSGSAQWDYRSSRGSLSTMLLGITGALAAPAISLVLFYLLTAPLLLYGAVESEGASTALGIDLIGCAPLLGKILFIFCTASGLGALLGSILRFQFLAPIVAITTLIATIVAAFNFSLVGEHERLNSASSDQLVCTDQSPRLCALPDNQPYLQAAQASVASYLDASPYAAVIPRTVLVADTPLYEIPSQLKHDYPITIQLERQRRLTTPQVLEDGNLISQNIEMSLAHACAQPLSEESERVHHILSATPKDEEERIAYTQELSSLLSCLRT